MLPGERYLTGGELAGGDVISARKAIKFTKNPCVHWKCITTGFFGLYERREIKSRNLLGPGYTSQPGASSRCISSDRRRFLYCFRHEMRFSPGLCPGDDVTGASPPAEKIHLSNMERPWPELWCLVHARGRDAFVGRRAGGR